MSFIVSFSIFNSLNELEISFIIVIIIYEYSYPCYDIFIFRFVIKGKVYVRYLKSFIKNAVTEINIVNDKRL